VELLLVISFLLGLALGSFINMAVYRIDKGEKFFGRSYCDNCHKELGFNELIPVLSYLIYRGRCRNCKKKISLSYPFVELASAGLSVLSFSLAFPYLANGNSLDFVIAAIITLSFFEFLLFFAVYDFLFWELDVLTLKVALVLGIILNLVGLVYPLPYLTDPLGNFLAAIILAGIIYSVVLLTDGSGMGAGDIYLFAFVGLFTGMDALLITFTLIVTIGAVFGVIKALILRKYQGLLIQFAPFICIGGILSFILHKQILQMIQSLFLFI